jgi:cytochrome c oxidase subunit 2
MLLACAGACGAPELPIDQLTIEVTGRNLEWHVRYPGADGVLGTPDDVLDRRDLHVPQGAATTVVLRSGDYIYSFALPEYGQREMAVPDMEFRIRFDPASAGTFELRGDNMCGYSHTNLVGKVVVMPPSEFRAWLRSRRG